MNLWNCAASWHEIVRYSDGRKVFRRFAAAAKGREHNNHGRTVPELGPNIDFSGSCQQSESYQSGVAGGGAVENKVGREVNCRKIAAAPAPDVQAESGRSTNGHFLSKLFSEVGTLDRLTH